MTFFEAIVAMGTNCLFTFNNEGERYVYSIDNNEPRANKYGETVVRDFRSMGKSVSTNLANMNVSPDEPKARAGLAVSDEKSCLVGLKLVPVHAGEN